MASKQLSYEVTGLAEAVKRLILLGERFPEGAALLMENFADARIILPAKAKFVPVVDGILRDSIKRGPTVVNDTQISVTIGAGGAAAPYALSVHENPRAGKTMGLSPSGKKYPTTKEGKPRWSTVGQWKYLEQPASEAANNSKGWLAREARAILRQLGRVR